MGILRHGILGGFSGKVGNVIGYNCCGKQVVKSLPKKSNKPATVAQQRQRMAFGLVTRFLLPLKEIINIAYGIKNGTTSKYHQLVSYHLKEAITGSFPDLEIDFSKVKLSTGHRGGTHAQIQAVGTELRFEWIDNSDMRVSWPDDMVILVAYNVTQNIHFYSAGPADRATQRATLLLNGALPGDNLHCWIAFMTIDRKSVSASNYLGRIVLP